MIKRPRLHFYGEACGWFGEGMARVGLRKLCVGGIRLMIRLYPFDIYRSAIEY
jgi:hypothetical protein